jgi:hypothetical protein
MTLSQFQAGKQLKTLDVATGYPEDKGIPAYIYPSELFITFTAEGDYCLEIGNWCDVSKDLAKLEAELYEWAIGEGYFQTT